jgi:murein DD-endopeptidase MepM/ murein hydrolase activator NlpD
VKRHRFRQLAAVAAALVGLLPGGDVVAGACLRPPVDAPISRAFEQPPCPWCAGHRGITYATRGGTPVVAAAAGTVTFSGVVVDIRYVVVRHGDGLLATYGGLRSTPVTEGDRVAAGALVGRTDGELHFGLRSDRDTYLDPQPHLGELVVPPYLVPTDGSAGRERPEPRLRC